MSAGLGTSVITGHCLPEQAQAIIDYHLYRCSRPRGPRDAPGATLAA